MVYSMSMKHVFLSNITWLYRYFDKNKSLFEIFSFLMVAQTFMYSGDLKGISEQSISAFRIVLWLMLFLIIILLQINISIEIKKDGEKLFGPMLKGANFMKTVMRLITLVLLLATVPIFIEQIQDSLHNSLFSVFYGSFAVIVLLESVTFLTVYIAPRLGIRRAPRD